MLNPIEEARFVELKNICLELKVQPPPEVFIHLQVHDKNGVLTFDDVQRGHSWTRNFYNLLLGTASNVGGDGTGTFGVGKMSGKKTSGAITSLTTRTPIALSGLILGSGFANNGITNTYGIVVGTVDTAFNANQFALAVIIPAGTAAGNFSYVAMAIPTQNYNSETKIWKGTLGRFFNNNSGGLITVKEIGLYWYGYMFNGSGDFMMERSVLSPVVDVVSGAQLTVTYEISGDFSAID
ncbi:MAG: hypothetical protein Q8J68_14700 [Methanolobus sp.]|uniref:hypothetical protein n=1 Tax=Methanolobus sp. TaxID=1874737 RepID=UPI00272F9AF6|nr:hypothetical protein [Methanolobus sp.]MDP2218524.1 hypothetical protein [Methanolobus sp.]